MARPPSPATPFGSPSRARTNLPQKVPGAWRFHLFSPVFLRLTICGASPLARRSALALNMPPPPSQDGRNGSGTGYVGLRFDTPGASNFGWLELDYVANGASTTLTVGGFAFEDQPGVAIAAGAEVSPIPEPGTWVALAVFAGGAAFARWRKRRDEAQKEAA